MSHEIFNNSAVYSARDGKAWHGLGQVIPQEIARDPRAIAELCGAIYDVVKAPAYYRGADGQFHQVKGREFVLRNDTGEAFEAVSDNRYHLDNRQPVEIFEAFRDQLNANKLEISHAAVLSGGATLAVSALMSDDFTLDVGGRGDAVQRYVTLMTGYNGKVGTKAFTGTIRVVCANTLAAGMWQADKQDTLRSIRASTVLEETSLKRLLERVESLQACDTARFNALANARMSSDQVSRYFADVLEINIADLGKVTANGKKVVSTKSENMLRALAAAYNSAPGAAIAAGTAWGALNAVTYYATHEKTVRDHHADGEDAARVASNLNGDAAKLKLRALQLAANYVPALALAA